MITSLTEPNWQPIVTIQKLPAGPAGLWTMVVPFVAAPRRLKIEASGNWNPAPTGQACGPDGQITAPGVTGLLLASALQGCLIGKIGGSPGDATIAAPGPTPVPGAPFIFAVGSFTTLDLPSNTNGPLFLTMNDTPAGFPGHKGEIVVSVYQASS